jgi:hypothetical protein
MEIRVVQNIVNGVFRCTDAVAFFHHGSKDFRSVPVFVVHVAVVFFEFMTDVSPGNKRGNKS